MASLGPGKCPSLTVPWAGGSPKDAGREEVGGEARQFPLVLRMNHISDMNKTQHEQHREKAEFCFRRERSNTLNESVSLLLRHFGKVRIWGQKKKTPLSASSLGFNGLLEAWGTETAQILHSLAALTGEKEFLTHT